MCEEKEGRRGSAGLCLGVSFHKCFATLVLKLEPCGNNHVQVYSMCSAWKIEGPDCMQNEIQILCLINSHLFLLNFISHIVHRLYIRYSFVLELTVV